MKYIKITIASVLLAAIIASSAHAVESPTLRITPAVNKIHLVPGSTGHYEIAVTNSNNSESNLKVYAEPYHQTAETYTQITRWIELEQDVYTIAADETINIPYSVHVPLDVPFGDQTAIIYIENIPLSSSGGGIVTPSPRVGSVVKAAISGDTRDGIEISELTLPRFLFRGPITSSGLVSNIGNTDFDASFHLTATGLFGNTLYDHENTFSILPGTTNTITQEWPNPPAIGIFRVHYSVVAFGKNSEITRTIIIVPKPFAIVLAIVLVLGISYLAIFVFRPRLRLGTPPKKR